MTSLDEFLSEVGANIWNHALGVTLIPSGGGRRGVAPGPMIQGRVQVTGQWEGTLVLQCSPGAARHAAGVMFDRHDGELTREEIHDTVGELASIIGGTVKSMVAADGCFLSLPVVLEGSDVHLRQRDSRVIAHQAFEDAGEPIVLTLLEAIG